VYYLDSKNSFLVNSIISWWTIFVGFDDAINFSYYFSMSPSSFFHRFRFFPPPIPVFGFAGTAFGKPGSVFGAGWYVGGGAFFGFG
jgi:hypothetical protein